MISEYVYFILSSSYLKYKALAIVYGYFYGVAMFLWGQLNKSSRFNLRMLHLQMSRRDFIGWQGITVTS